MHVWWNKRLHKQGKKRRNRRMHGDGTRRKTVNDFQNMHYILRFITYRPNSLFKLHEEEQIQTAARRSQ